jgi:hypothetical protein
LCCESRREGDFAATEGSHAIERAEVPAMSGGRLRLSVVDARDLAEGALRGIGYRDEEARTSPIT